MGVCYYLVRDDNETMFDLGKGPWVDDARDLSWPDSTYVAWGPVYCAEIYRRVLEWAAGQSFRMINDCGDEYDELRYEPGSYRLTGSRFPDHFQLVAGVNWDDPPAEAEEHCWDCGAAIGPNDFHACPGRPGENQF